MYPEINDIMNTLLRRALLVLGPAPLAAITFGVIAAVVAIGKQRPLPTDLLEGVAMVSLSGTFFTILPAIAMTVMIERRFAEGLNPRSGKCLGLLTGFGLASGTLIGLVVACMGPGMMILLPVMMALGAWVGFLLGLIVRIPWFTPRHD